MKIVCISDTHGGHAKVQVPDGDILVCSGDITPHGRLASLDSFDAWMGQLPHRHKFAIAGNHDFCFEETPAEARAKLRNVTYLQDEAVEIEGLKIYGSPWQPVFCRMAFNLGPDEIRKRWAAIPSQHRSTDHPRSTQGDFGLHLRWSAGRVPGAEQSIG